MLKILKYYACWISIIPSLSKGFVIESNPSHESKFNLLDQKSLSHVLCHKEYKSMLVHLAFPALLHPLFQHENIKFKFKREV